MQLAEGNPTVTHASRDAAFAGLQPQMLDSEPVREAAAVGGRYIRVSEDGTVEEDVVQ